MKLVIDVDPGDVARICHQIERYGEKAVSFELVMDCERTWDTVTFNVELA